MIDGANMGVVLESFPVSALTPAAQGNLIPYCLLWDLLKFHVGIRHGPS